MDNIDVVVNMIEPLIPEYEKVFHKLSDMEVEIPKSMKVVFVFFRVHREIDKHPVYILCDVVSMNDVGKVIKRNPTLPKNLPKKLRDDINQYEVVVRNGSYVHSKISGGSMCGGYPVFSTLNSDQLKTLIKLGMSDGTCSEGIVNEYFGNLKFTV